MRILLVLLYLTLSLYSADYVDDFPLYIEGDSGYIAYFLNAAAMLANDDQFRILLGMAITVSIVISGWQMLQGGLSIPFKASATILAGIGLMFTPVTVHVVDKRTEQGFLLTSTPGCTVTDTYRVIANVPYIIALPASMASTFGYGLRQAIGPSIVPIINSVGEVVDLAGVQTSSGGHGVPADMIKKIWQTANLGGNNPVMIAFKHNFELYIKDCVLGYSYIKGQSYDDVLFNPTGDLFQAISPGRLNYNSADTIVHSITGTEITETCEDFYNNRVGGSALNTVKDALVVKVQANTEQCVSYTAVADAMKDAGYFSIAEDLNATGITSMSGITALKSYIINAAVAPSLISASEEFGGSGTILANRMTAALSKAKMQMEGTGGYHFAVDMLPKSIHFIYGIVLFLGILVGASALAQPYQNSLKIYMGYMISFVMFEVIKLSILIVDGAVMFYESGRASDKLAAMNLNGASFANMSAHLDNIATMTALSGTIGTMMIFAIPGILLKGNFFSLMGMLGAGGQKYAGNDLDTSLGAKAQKTGADLAINALMNDATAMKRLKSMNIDIPSGVGALEYYNNIQQQMSTMSSGAGAMVSSNTLQNQSKVTMVQSASKNVEMAGHGSIIDTSSALSVASENGITAASTINNTRKARDTKEVIDSDGKKHKWNAADVGKASAFSSTMKEMQSASWGNDVDLADAFTNAVNDGITESQMVTDTRKTRDTPVPIKDEEGDIIGHEKWGARKVALGNARAKVAKDFESMGAVNGVINDALGVEDMLAGSMKLGREGVNKTMAEGEVWGAKTDAQKVDFMKKVKENQKVKAFGGVEAENAEIMKHGGVDGAKKDMITNAQKKGIDSAADAKTLRGNYGNNINGSKSVVSKEEKKAAKVAIKEAEKELEALNEEENSHIWTNSESDKEKAIKNNNKKKELNGKIEAANATINNNDSMTLSQQAEEISQSKIDSTLGQAVGIKANRAAGVNLSENAMYGEMSKQQGIKAKIDTMGGVSNAVGLDVMDAGQKASQQKGAVEGLQKEAEDIGKKIGKSAAQVMQDAANT
ncbi:MAG: conjugal transfer protein TraG N-terminal domain-containing protein, partial [Proteobacteria bacterium]|nr:conjugal transfer protein TraG N-terminal domain-containing protein [Pseudomonadota bacterium]